MSNPKPGWIPRPVRVAFPVQASFAAHHLEIEEFAANLSEGGAFLPTDQMVPPLTQGTLTFRLAQWEEPFTVQAEVVWNAPTPGEDHPAGIGLQFLDITERDKLRLRRLVEGIQDGSVVEALRRRIREGQNLHKTLRNLPMDQKVMLATYAQREEIDALIHDGNPTVIVRLMDNPRLTTAKMKILLRDPRMPAKILIAIRRKRQALADADARQLFCAHPNAPIAEVLALLPQLPRPQLAAMAENQHLRTQVRLKAKQLVKRQGG